MFKIAICDDNKYDIKDISAALESLKDEGIDIELACYTDGRKLIADFESGVRYHLLILDMVMEPINGIETAKGLRKSDVSMPILIVTSTREFALDGYLVNAWRYITKPIDHRKFVDEVRGILESMLGADGIPSTPLLCSHQRHPNTTTYGGIQNEGTENHSQAPGCGAGLLHGRRRGGRAVQKHRPAR